MEFRWRNYRFWNWKKFYKLKRVINNNNAYYTFKFQDIILKETRSFEDTLTPVNNELVNRIEKVVNEAILSKDNWVEFTLTDEQYDNEFHVACTGYGFIDHPESLWHLWILDCVDVKVVKQEESDFAETLEIKKSQFNQLISDHKSKLGKNYQYYLDIFLQRDISSVKEQLLKKFDEKTLKKLFDKQQEINDLEEKVNKLSQQNQTEVLPPSYNNLAIQELLEQKYPNKSELTEIKIPFSNTGDDSLSISDYPNLEMFWILAPSSCDFITITNCPKLSTIFVMVLILRELI
ncbi:MAG: hypothetical protein mread185_000561 [Mycoplasmataceae bacterium]|nr:MAG: hypothetical protein mread185_000561 [Mycoplasmataceae bacterium]